MNILRLSTLSLILAIAVITLGYAGYSSAAPPCSKKPVDGCRDDSGDGNDTTETEFMVEMHPGTVGGADGLVTSNGVACGITEGEINGGRFPDGCVTVSANFITDPGAPLILRAFTFGVRFNRSEAKLFFTDGPIAYPDRNPGDGYGLGGLPMTVIPDGSSPSGSTPFTVKVNMSGLFAIKSHQPRKGDLVGPIAIGEIVYTPTAP